MRMPLLRAKGGSIMEKDSFVKSVSRALKIMDILSNYRHELV